MSRAAKIGGFNHHGEDSPHARPRAPQVEDTQVRRRHKLRSRHHPRSKTAPRLEIDFRQPPESPTA